MCNVGHVALSLENHFLEAISMFLPYVEDGIGTTKVDAFNADLRLFVMSTCLGNKNVGFSQPFSEFCFVLP